MTTMPQSADFDAIRCARLLARSTRQASLATLMPGSGDPYCSLVNIGTTHDGCPVLLISRLALHTKNILADGRVSLMFDERSTGHDPLERARLMMGGHAAEIGADRVGVVRRRYLSAHPSAEVFVDFSDFSFFQIRPAALHLVAGFGRITDLPPAAILTDLTDAGDLIDAEPDAVAHLNTDHRDAVGLYATRLLGAGSGDWRCVGIDPDGMDLQAESRATRLDFPRRIVTPGALRHLLKELADRARALPEP